MKKSIIALGGLAMLTALSGAHAGDAAAGEQRYTTCAACHQPNGAGAGIFPPLKGLDAATVTEKLETYRDGEQIGSNSALMIPQARPLSDDDIANLAAYIEQSFN